MYVFWKCGIPVGYLNHAYFLLFLEMNDPHTCRCRVNHQIFILFIIALHPCYRPFSGVIEYYFLGTIVSSVRALLVREVVVVMDQLPLGVADEKLYELSVTMDKRDESKGETSQLYPSLLVCGACPWVILICIEVEVFKFLKH